MALTQMELNTLKSLISTEDVNAKKMQLYAQNCQDTQLQGFFTQAAQQAQSNTETLMSFLNNVK